MPDTAYKNDTCHVCSKTILANDPRIKLVPLHGQHEMNICFDCIYVIKGMKDAGSRI